jgi:hypothetical protein
VLVFLTSPADRLGYFSLRICIVAYIEYDATLIDLRDDDYRIILSLVQSVADYVWSHDPEANIHAYFNNMAVRGIRPAVLVGVTFNSELPLMAQGLLDIAAALSLEEWGEPTTADFVVYSL